MKKRKLKSPSPHHWNNWTPPVDPRIALEEKRGIAVEKGKELQSFPFESVVDCAEFVSNLRIVAGRGIRASEDAVASAETQEDAQFSRAEAGFWRGVKACCKAVEKGSTIAM